MLSVSRALSLSLHTFLVSFLGKNSSHCTSYCISVLTFRLRNFFLPKASLGFTE